MGNECKLKGEVGYVGLGLVPSPVGVGVYHKTSVKLIRDDFRRVKRPYTTTTLHTVC